MGWRSSGTPVERFLTSEGLSLSSRHLELPRLRRASSTVAAAAQAGSEVAANSGRWVQLTEESAQALKKYALMMGASSGTSRGVLTENGQIKGLLELVTTPGSLLTNPALLAGVGGLMAQLAMQQTMDEITDYLATIDKKVDDVLRSQKDAVLADMIGVDLVIEEAMTVRDQVGRVSEVTWSKVQATAATLTRTQAYALRQLDALAEQLEQTTKIADLAKMSKEAEVKVQEWLAVLARCFRLQDAYAVLELDRVLDAAPDELDQHRLGLRLARQHRLNLISQCTERLMARVDAAAGRANAKVLLHPNTSREIVHSSNRVVGAVVELRSRLGIERNRQSLEARRWLDAAAAAAVRDRALEAGAGGVDDARRLGKEAVDRTRSATGRFSSRISKQVRRRQGGDGADCR